MYDDNFSPEQIELLPDALPPEDASLVRALQTVYQSEADSHKHSLERVRARLVQQKVLGHISLPTQSKSLEGKVINIKEKKIIGTRNVLQEMSSSMPRPQVKKRGSIVRMVGISIIAAATLITILSFTIFSNGLLSTQQMAGRQQTAQQKEISHARLVCSVGLNARPLPPFGTASVGVSWSAQGRVATSAGNNFTLFSAKDCGAKTTKPTTFYEGSWSSDGKKLVVVSASDNALNVLDKDGNSIANIPFTKLGTMFVGRLAWSSDGTKFTFISRDSNHQESVKTADAADGGNVKTLMTIDGDGGAKGFGDFSPDGRYVLVTDLKEHSVWDVNTRKKISDLPSDDGQGDSSAEAFSPDSSLFARSGRGKVEIYSSADGKLQNSFKVDEGTGDLAWSHDSKYLAASWRSISIYDVSAKKVVTKFGLVDAKHQISNISWAPDDSGLVSSTSQILDDGNSQIPVNVWALS